MKDTIKLFPSNWLYNASVIGFLKVMAHGLGEEEVEEWLNDDGTIDVDNDCFEQVEIGELNIPKSLECYINYISNKNNIIEWKAKNESKYKKFYDRLGEFGYKYIFAGNKLFASNTPYQNLVQLQEWQSFEFPNFLIEKLIDYEKINGDKNCGFCSKLTAQAPSDDNLLEQRLFVYQEPHMRRLGPSIGKFRNSFWNLENSLVICPLCAYLFIYSHLPFIRSQNREIFINTFSFKLMWYLNKYVGAVYKNTNIEDIFATSLMELSQKMNRMLGLWSKFNIEMVIKTYNDINYYSLPYATSKLLLNRNISSLIRKTKEPFVLNSIISGKYDNLMKLCSKVMKSIASGKPDLNDNYISQLSSKKVDHLKELSSVLPELYVKIDKLLN